MSSPRDFERLARKLENFGDRIEEKTTEEIDRQIRFLRTEAQVNLSVNRTNWRGILRDSMLVTRRERADGNTKHELTVTAPWGKYVEFGTGVFFSNEDPARDVRRFSAPDDPSNVFPHIFEWVKTKPVIPRHYSSKRDVAWAISHTIAELGTSAQPFLRPAYAQRKPKIVSAVKLRLKNLSRRHF